MIYYFSLELKNMTNFIKEVKGIYLKENIEDNKKKKKTKS